jgi:hypothetical protein
VWPWAVFVVMLVVGAATGPAAYALVRAGWSAQAAKTSLNQAVAHVGERDISAAVEDLDAAHGHLVSARASLRGVGFWRDMPSIGTQVRALEDAASAGVATVDGLRGLLGVAASLLDASSAVDLATGALVNPVEGHRSYQELSPEEKREMLARLSRALPDIRVAQAKVAVALEAWERIPQDRLVAPLRTAFQPIAEQLPRLKRTLDEAIPFLEVLVPLAGYPTPTTYLVVLQNSDEIRATGGFLGTWGILQIDGGDIGTFAFDDVYALDRLAGAGWNEVPPAPIKERLGVPAWFFRDANWSPDFPTSAERLSDFYVRETQAGTGQAPTRPDGVIALNAPFFEGLLRMTGPITVDDVTFTADNFFDELEYEVEQRFLEKGISEAQRKQILLKLGEELLARLTDLPASRWPDLLDLVTDSLTHKQIQMYARDATLLAKLDAFGWTGRAKPTQGDFLWVIDSNLAALKTDGVMDKEVQYTLDARNPARPLATVTLRYTNRAPGFQEFRYTRYRDYVRLYVPEGAELVEVRGAMKDDRYRTGGRAVAGAVDTYRDLGKTVFGAFWSIEPGSTQELVFSYHLPPAAVADIAAGTYRLDIPKQSGNDEGTWALDLRFGKNIKRAMPSEEPSRFGDAAYQADLDSAVDRTVEITF